MASRLDSLRMFEPVLTQLSRGYHNDALIADQVFPFVSVDKEVGEIPIFGKEMFYVYDTKRAIRAKSNRKSEGAPTLVAFKTDEHDLEEAIDYREEKEAFFNQQSAITMRLQENLRLEHEYLCSLKLSDTATYATANVETVTDHYYDNAAEDPIPKIQGDMDALRDIIGVYPNKMLMGAQVWNALKRHPLLQAYFPQNSKGIVTLDWMKALIEMPDIFVGNARYSVDKATFGDIWGNGIWYFYVMPPQGAERNPHEPMFGYTLQVKGNPYVDSYEENGGKIKVIRNTDNYGIYVVGNDSGYYVKNPITP